MKYDDEKQYDLTSSHQHLFESCKSDIRTKPNSKPARLMKSDSDKDFIQELVVIGYGSNLYRDNINALKLEDRTYLIPWNGDENLLIDRYDCRGYLYDLEPYDSDLINKTVTRLTNEEIEIENLCEQERYADLIDDESKIQKDEIEKQGASIHFNYDANTNPNKNLEPESQNSNKPLNEEKSFIPPESLKLPSGMLIPETVKMNQIIVKTASFVSKEGLQMEILLKAKQSANSQFDFLNYDHTLNAYYKHILSLIKANQIDPSEFLFETTNESNKKEEKQQTDDESDDGSENGYLHPLLQRTATSSSSNKTSKPEEEKTIEIIKDSEGKENDYFNKSEPNNIQVEKHGQANTSLDMPSGVLKVIIDKFAEYVCKNGFEFEEMISNKNDERFEFIKPEHKFNSYYRSQIEKLQSIKVDESNEKDKRTASMSNDESSDKESTTSSDKQKKHKKSKSSHRHHRHHHKKHHKHHRHRDSSQEQNDKVEDKKDDRERRKRSKRDSD